MTQVLTRPSARTQVDYDRPGESKESIMQVGFTGTRHGMTNAQALAFQLLISHRKFDKLIIFRHGDCVGSDEEAHLTIRRTRPGVKIFGHPPINEKYRAFCHFDYQADPLEYIERDHAIVNNSDVVIATPRERAEVIRSGTWTTMRYAKKQNIPVMVIWPNGKLGSW